MDISYLVSKQAFKSTPFIFFDPIRNAKLKCINLLMFQRDLDAHFDDICQFTQVAVINLFLEPSLKKNWRKIHEPKSPPFSHKIAGIFSEVSQRSNKCTWNVLDCVDSFLTNFFPNRCGDDVLLASGIKSLKLTHPHVNKVLDYIFEEEMHKIPWDTTRIVDGSHARPCWHTFDTEFHS